MKHATLNKLHTQVRRAVAVKDRALSNLIKFQILDVGELQLVAVVVGDSDKGLLPSFKDLGRVIDVYKSAMAGLGLKPEEVAAVTVPDLVQFKVRSASKFDWLEVTVGTKTFKPSLSDLQATAKLINEALGNKLKAYQLKVRPKIS